ncbi:helix-turn-helix domain-containing protein (plasmid) [Phyllobacteriaceae bacterium JZ32]
MGYESPSAFIAMFRRMLGTTPARYLTETAVEASAGRKENVFHICGEQCPHRASQPAGNVVPMSRRERSR